jgi:ArsR family transcriptional regulator, lead/cadmium/zinc/bismuth-responsive transcriptional repressor
VSPEQTLMAAPVTTNPADRRPAEPGADRSASPSTSRPWSPSGQRRPAAPAAAEEVCEVFQADPETISRVRARMIAETVAADLADTFRALGDPTRVRILDAISGGELCVCDLAALVGLSESAVSHQLRLLRHMRLVRARRHGRMVFYSLDDHHIIELFGQGLRHVQEAARAGALRAQGADSPER